MNRSVAGRALLGGRGGWRPVFCRFLLLSVLVAVRGVDALVVDWDREVSCATALAGRFEVTWDAEGRSRLMVVPEGGAHRDSAVSLGRGLEEFRPDLWVTAIRGGETGPILEAVPREVDPDAAESLVIVDGRLDSPDYLERVELFLGRVRDRGRIRSYLAAVPGGVAIWLAGVPAGLGLAGFLGRAVRGYGRGCGPAGGTGREGARAQE